MRALVLFLNVVNFSHPNHLTFYSAESMAKKYIKIFFKKGEKRIHIEVLGARYHQCTVSSEERVYINLKGTYTLWLRCLARDFIIYNAASSPAGFINITLIARYPGLSLSFFVGGTVSLTS